MSDGVWQWPEGLVHYVECHSLRLPDEFVATMEGTGGASLAKPRSVRDLRA